ncbi:acyltransferase family protein [Flavobacterium sp. TMP13]|uniref:acyltransferase family protein n=1 Tax=Flavobacterium sp. TMP13 TaxID=3425950 RepID=UPI003D783CA3
MKDKIYFPNLNGLRFIAAFMVIFSHLELNKPYFGMPNYFREVKHLGKLGVSLFFVLSGFLITFLLLMEKENGSKILYRSFYMRRILRIWPLYYFIVILSLFVLPYFELFNITNFKMNLVNPFEYLKVILLFLLFLPNLLIQIKLVPFATQTWSIGTEEQFYLIWPWIINNGKRLKLLFIALIIGYNLISYLVEIKDFQNLPYFNMIKGFVHLLQLDVLTIGALAAYLLYSKHKILFFFANTPLFIFSIISTILIIALNVKLIFGNSVLYGFHFAVIILCLIHNPKLKNLLENRFFNYLGKFLMVYICIIK